MDAGRIHRPDDQVTSFPRGPARPRVPQEGSTAPPWIISRSNTDIPPRTRPTDEKQPSCDIALHRLRSRRRRGDPPRRSCRPRSERPPRAVRSHPGRPVRPLCQGRDPMNAIASTNLNTFAGGIWAALRALIVDRPFTPARRARLRAAREADRAWATMVALGADPRALERLAAIMTDKPPTCEKCGGHAYVCRAIGCDPDRSPTNVAPPKLRVARS